jgi:HK97 family phage prohead protease
VIQGRFPNGIETRTAATEFRVAQGRTLSGYAAIFNRPANIGSFTEIIRHGAFAASLAGGTDIFLLGHHDFAQPLARTGNGSLHLHEDPIGLSFEAALPQTRAADDILELARSGTIAGASIGFRVMKGGESWPTRDKRELTALELIEVSAVAQPAYSGTSIAARSIRSRLRILALAAF